MVHELLRAFAETDADADADVCVVVMTSHGRAYRVGADVSGGPKALDAEGRGWGDDVGSYRDTGGPIALTALRSTKPIIGTVHGVAAGLGATMLLPMDLVLAAESVRLAFVSAKRASYPRPARPGACPARWEPAPRQSGYS